MKKIKNNQIVAQYGEFLESMDWNFFCTFTTPYTLSTQSARRLMERMKIYLRRKNINVTIFWMAEPFDLKYGYHVHALIKVDSLNLNNSKYYISAISKAWKLLSNGNEHSIANTHILLYEKGKGANFYVAKYMFKNNCEYDFEL